MDEEKSKKKKWSLGGMYASSIHYVGVKLLDSYTGGKYQPLDIMLGKHSSMGLFLRIFSFLVSSSLNNETTFRA